MLHMRNEAPALDRRDWEVVQIAIRDAASLGCNLDKEGHPILSRFLGAFRTVIGSEPCRPLADPRLETLRRFLSASRRKRRIEERFVPDLIAYGFNRRQLDALAMLEA